MSSAGVRALNRIGRGERRATPGSARGARSPSGGLRGGGARYAQPRVGLLVRQVAGRATVGTPRALPGVALRVARAVLFDSRAPLGVGGAAAREKASPGV